ncbi:D(4) dopamine receptor-like [Protopterus annectens]|uniref:D(4) dopamine receptor-like n=1 Tax=Protopterus annectens TaxID=7888 RepID=UPI001CFBF773|nr:D(4) dopamine receptor-like [Protopterus annectens]
MVTNCTINDTTPLLSENIHYNFPVLIFGIFIIIFIIGGNVLVCISVCTERALKTTTNYFIMSLAVADLLLAVLVLPLYVYSEFQEGIWSLSTALCDALMTMDVMLCTASIFNLCAISVDRFIAVSIPLTYNRRQIDHRQIFLISTTWIVAFAVACPVIFGINNVTRRDPSVCQLEDNNYIIYSSICSFFIPCPIMLCLYCWMFRGLRKWEGARKAKLRNNMHAFRKIQGGHMLAPCPSPVMEKKPVDANLDGLNIYTHTECTFPAGYLNRPVQTVAFPEMKYTHVISLKKHAKINGRERKAMKVLPVVIGAFLFCWTPFFVVHITRALCDCCDIPAWLVSTVTWLGYVNSALNPIIYTVFNTEFRNYFNKVLHACWKCS